MGKSYSLQKQGDSTSHETEKNIIRPSFSIRKNKTDDHKKEKNITICGPEYFNRRNISTIENKPKNPLLGKNNVLKPSAYKSINKKNICLIKKTNLKELRRNNGRITITMNKLTIGGIVIGMIILGIVFFSSGFLIGIFSNKSTNGTLNASSLWSNISSSSKKPMPIKIKNNVFTKIFNNKLENKKNALMGSSSSKIKRSLPPSLRPFASHITSSARGSVNSGKNKIFGSEKNNFDDISSSRKSQIFTNKSKKPSEWTKNQIVKNINIKKQKQAKPKVSLPYR